MMRHVSYISLLKWATTSGVLYQHKMFFQDDVGYLLILVNINSLGKYDNTNRVHVIKLYVSAFFLYLFT